MGTELAPLLRLPEVPLEVNYGELGLNSGRQRIGVRRRDRNGAGDGSANDGSAGDGVSVGTLEVEGRDGTKVRGSEGRKKASGSLDDVWKRTSKKGQRQMSLQSTLTL
ncbi:hypothetical protein CVT26_015464 [Gymnopilus dilepis]|uniref:Uncharacterized protein n=1 Tax=Gymnopilus dilepis TaxID=231916 RepID=A0A409WM73_9AGAR|nr:hypothetical protein CVT26_015464 [Gymnopilus dilepis]